MYVIYIIHPICPFKSSDFTTPNANEIIWKSAYVQSFLTQLFIGSETVTVWVYVCSILALTYMQIAKEKAWFLKKGS